MTIPTMTQCPKCQSTDVFVKNGDGVGFDVYLKVGVDTGMRSTGDWATWLCTNCGYFENYLTKAEWLAQIKADPQAAGWRKAE